MTGFPINKSVVPFAALFFFLTGLPLIGAWLAGHPFADYLQFPPQPTQANEFPFSWPIFFLYLVLETPLYAACGFLLWRCRLAVSRFHPFPHWGRPALLWLLLAWYLSWTRPEWLGPLRDWTFTPLWLGYIFVVNAFCEYVRGWSPLTRYPRFFLGLFPLSALFWWYFEYLNRFVGNWQYLGVENLTPWQYFWRATLPFGTVLPAVVSTIVLLGAFFGPARGVPSLCLRHPRAWAWAALILAGGGLIGVGVWPQWCYPLLWVAPLVLFVSLQVLLGERTYFYPLRQGRWEIVAVPMLAALICGFFWEMWNYWSWPKWVYHVPWVGRFKVFEMPILGYAGYLPFGLECAVVADWWGRLCGQRDIFG